jgi:hypothetical protein
MADWVCKGTNSEFSFGSVMRESIKKTAIYLVCFHSKKPQSLDGAERQYRNVETANLNGEWPITKIINNDVFDKKSRKFTAREG